MFVRILRAEIFVTCVVGLLALPAACQSSSCWFPLTVEVVGEHPSFQKLSKKNIAVRVNGRATEVSGIDLRTATKLIVALDTSGSMGSHGWKGLGVLVGDLLRGAPASVEQVGLTTFSDTATYASGREDSLKLLDETMRQGAYGRTRLADALLDSARHFQAGTDTLIIVITDGGDNRSLNSSTDDRRELLRRGVRTTFIIPRYQKPGTVEEMFADDFPRELADATGGNTIYLDGIPEDANHVLEPDATRKLMEYYKVMVPAVRGKLKVGLENELGRHAKDLKVHHPRVVNCETGIALK